MIARAICAPFRYHARTMKKRPPQPSAPRAGAPPPGRRPFELNRNLNRQTRKMLAKHYRAKYGVK